MSARVAPLLLVGLTWGCGDPCGPGDAPVDGLTLTGDGLALQVTGLEAGLNNDCPAPDAPAGVVSLSIHGQSTGTGAPFTLCVPRPDQLQAGPLPLDELIFVDVNTDDGCALEPATDGAPSGTVRSAGMCGGGGDPHGFALVFDGAFTFDRDCAGTIDEVRVTLAGEIAVAPPP
jgi:hypothetical protein